MDGLVAQVRSNFGGSNCIANKEKLVDWDGYDELEKKGAVEFFENKNWESVLTHLREGNSYYLEEWSVLNVDCLSYYARAYFEYLLETLERDNPDEEFVFFLFCELYQVVYMHKGSPFNETQTEAINKLVQYSLGNEKLDRFEYFSDSVKESGEQYFTELEKFS
jgi:hypothetical protein